MKALNNLVQTLIIPTVVIASASVAQADWDVQTALEQNRSTYSSGGGSYRKASRKRTTQAAPRVSSQRLQKQIVKTKTQKKVSEKKVEPKVTNPKEVTESQPVTEPSKTVAIEATEGQTQDVMARFAHLDPKHQIAREPLKKAILFYATNQHKIANSRYMGVIDFSKNSSQPRFCVIDMRSGDTQCMKTAHGYGSEAGNGWAGRFSNVHSSGASSLGYYMTKQTYTGKHGTSLNLDGLSSTNSNALARRVVIHSAGYVNDRPGARTGYSAGCPALSYTHASSTIQKMKGGALIYAWHGKHMGREAMK